MNELGAVVGWTELPRSTDHAAFVWSGSGLPPKLFSVPGVEKTAATDINVHGDYIVSTGGGGSQAWLVSRGELTVLKGVGPRAMPYSINDHGKWLGGATQTVSVNRVFGGTVVQNYWRIEDMGVLLFK